MSEHVYNRAVAIELGAQFDQLLRQWRASTDDQERERVTREALDVSKRWLAMIQSTPPRYRPPPP